MESRFELTFKNALLNAGTAYSPGSKIALCDPHTWRKIDFHNHYTFFAEQASSTTHLLPPYTPSSHSRGKRVILTLKTSPKCCLYRGRGSLVTKDSVLAPRCPLSLYSPSHSRTPHSAASCCYLSRNLARLLGMAWACSLKRGNVTAVLLLAQK